MLRDWMLDCVLSMSFLLSAAHAEYDLNFTPHLTFSRGESEGKDLHLWPARKNALHYLQQVPHVTCCTYFPQESASGRKRALPPVGGAQKSLIAVCQN